MMMSRESSSSSASCLAYSSSLRGAIAEVVARGLDGADKHVDLLGRIVHVEAGAHGAGDAQMAHEGLSAMVAGSDRHPVAVEDGADIVGMEVRVVEGDDATTVGGRGRTVDHNVLQLAEAAEAILGQLKFVRPHVIHADFAQV